MENTERMSTQPASDLYQSISTQGEYDVETIRSFLQENVEAVL